MDSKYLLIYKGSEFSLTADFIKVYDEEFVSFKSFLIDALESENKLDMLEEIVNDTTYIAFEDVKLKNFSYDTNIVPYFNEDTNFFMATISLGEVSVRNLLFGIGFYQLPNTEDSKYYFTLKTKIPILENELKLEDVLKYVTKDKKNFHLESWTENLVEVHVGSNVYNSYQKDLDLLEIYGEKQILSLSLVKVGFSGFSYITYNIFIYPVDGNEISASSRLKIPLSKMYMNRVISDIYDVLSRNWDLYKDRAKVYINGKRYKFLDNVLTYVVFKNSDIIYEIKVIERQPLTKKIITFNMLYSSPDKKEKQYITKFQISQNDLFRDVIQQLLGDAGIFTNAYNILKNMTIYMNDVLVEKKTLRKRVLNMPQIKDTDFIKIRIYDSQSKLLIRQLEYIEKENIKKGKLEQKILDLKLNTSLNKAQRELVDIVSLVTSITKNDIMEEVEIGSHGITISSINGGLRMLKKKLKESENVKTTYKNVYFNGKTYEKKHLKGYDFTSTLQEFFSFKKTKTSFIMPFTIPGHQLLLIIEKNYQHQTANVLILDPSSSSEDRSELNLIGDMLSRYTTLKINLIHTVFNYQVYDNNICNIGGGHCASFSIYLIIYYYISYENYYNKLYTFDEMFERLEKVGKLTETNSTLLNVISYGWVNIFKRVLGKKGEFLKDEDEANLLTAWRQKEDWYLSLERQEAIKQLLESFKVAYYEISKSLKEPLNFVTDVLFLDTFIQFNTGFDDAAEAGTKISIIINDLLSEDGVLRINQNMLPFLESHLCSTCKSFKKNIFIENSISSGKLFCGKKCQRHYYKYLSSQAL